MRGFWPAIWLLCATSELCAGPQIRVKKGDCPVVAKTVEEVCYSQITVANNYYVTFIETNIRLIKGMYLQMPTDSCATVAKSVGNACKADCSEVDCIWLLADPEEQRLYPASPNDRKFAPGFYDQAVFDVGSDVPPVPAAVVYKVELPVVSRRPAVEAPKEAAAAPIANPNYIPGSFLLGTPTRQIRQ